MGATQLRALYRYAPRVVVVLCAFAALFVGIRAFADTQPSIGGGADGRMYYSLSRSEYTLANQNIVGVYFPANATGNRTIQISTAARRGGANFRFSIKIGSNDTIQRDGANIGSGISQVVNLSSVPVDSTTNKKMVPVVLKQLSAVEGYYRFSISSSDGLVRPRGGDVTSYDTITGSWMTNIFKNYTLNFGSDCTVTSATWRTIRLVDPDNYVNGSWYGDQSAQGYYTGSGYAGRTMQVYVQRAPVGSSSFSNLTAADYQLGSHVVGSGSGAGYRVVPQGAVTLSGRERASTFNIRMRPGEIYRLQVTNLKTNNSIQIQLPTDSIYYDTGCNSDDWSVNGRTRIKNGSAGAYTPANITATPGNTLYWDHQLTRGGTRGNPSSVNYTISRSEEGSATSVLDRSSTNTLPFTRSADSLAGYRRTVTQDHVGGSICQTLTWNPRAYNNSGGGTTSACATIPYNYSLMPSLVVPSTIISEGATTVNNISGSIANSGPTKSKTGVNYGISRFVVRGGGPTTWPGGTVTIPYDPSVPGNLVSDWNSCYIPQQITTVATSDCARVYSHGSGGDLGVVPREGRTMGNGSFSDDLGGLSNPLSVGDKVCYVSFVSTYTKDHNSDQFRYQAPICVTVAKSPKVQFWGADVRSSQQVITGRSELQSRIYGSWAEYGLFGGQLVVSSSGAGLSSGDGGRDPVVARDYNQLTFANTGTSFGSYGAMALRDPTITLTGGEPLNTETVNAINDLANGRYQRTGNLTIQGGTVQQGKTIVIRATGTVTIAGDLLYETGPYSRIGNVPQLVIIASSIIINDTVQNVNAWLVAPSGYVSTCGAVTGGWLVGINSTTCVQPLKINGPVVANRLYLRRTHGGERTNPGLPAEILNLRPDAYLWAYGQSRTSGAIKTTYTRELPPRF